MEKDVQNKFKNIKLSKLKFLPASAIDKLDKNDLHNYIERLHSLLKKQAKKLRKYKEKANKKDRKKDTKSDTTATATHITTTTKVAPSSSTNSVNHDQITLKQENVIDSDHDNDSTDNGKEFVEKIKAAAQAAVEENGFVYEPTSGLYYDNKTGYYYNAEHGLYYDGNTGCYYTYNQDENKFEFYSQAYATETSHTTQTIIMKHNNDDKDDNGGDDTDKTDDDEDDNQNHKVSSKVKGASRLVKRKKTNKDHKRDDKRYNIEREDGELSSNDDENNDDNIVAENKMSADKLQKNDNFDKNNAKKMNVDRHYEVSELAQRYPPSLRIVVLDTNLPKLKIGELFIITFKGGTLGREGEHDVIIPDINVSKYHLKFTYNNSKSHYECIDLGSRNGTLLNGKRMSNAKQESELHRIDHGDNIKLSQTKLLCHIHEGLKTCSHCEPGLMTAAAANTPPYDSSLSSAIVDLDAQTTTASTSALTHKEGVKRLKKRYGLEEDKYVILQKMKNDRAEQRRKDVGSTNPYEKTVTASIDTSIAPENKGFKMLAKLGWSEGQALGTNKTGILEPIPMKTNAGTRGLGCDEMAVTVSTKPFTKRTEKKIREMKITQARYDKAELNKNINENDDGIKVLDSDE